ncbi:MAG: hypothetical protein ACRC8S_08745 [Fimbriiglobus sp.]
MKKFHVEVIDREYAAILATKTPAEKAAMINDCHRTARIFMAAGERMRHPEYTEEQIQAAVAKRLLDGSN